MTIGEITKRLSAAGIADAAYEARLMAEYYTGIDQSRLVMMRNQEIESAELESAAARREKREPLQYILGKWEFMDHEYYVSPDCLIPREDTAVLVENGLKHVPADGIIADLCTGSGCVAISMLLKRPDITAYAAELYHNTAEIALKNAESLGVSERFHLTEGDVTEDIFEKSDMFDVIVSNPPYIPSRDVDELEPELSFEPRAALDGGADGLDIIKSIMKIYPAHIKKGGALLIEIGYDIGAETAGLAEKLIQSGGADSYEIIKDTGDRDRVIFIQI